MARTKKATAYALRRSKEYKAVHRDLVDQLERNGTFGEHYQDLINDYMDMWITKCLLVTDIETRGVIVGYDNGGGQSGRKKNESVELRLKVNAQMLKLLGELGIKSITTRPPSDGGGDSGKGSAEEDHL